ncbi:hypothetical protein HPHPH5B_0179 [Helicobacter pylori Hp H-5b]|nr:hypothetical protein HPHPH5B_0179 [Helicobacter pylori Hp H-5b]
MNTPLTPPQLTLPLRTLFKIQPKLFIIKLVQKTPSFRAQDVSA